MSELTVAFIGLGVMGYPMAGHCVKAGFQVRVFNRTHAKAEKWTKEFGGEAFRTPREAAETADIILLCVGNDDDVRSVVYGDDGVLAGVSANTLLVDHTTTSAELARELNSACLENQVGFLDAPVSGGQAGAEHGQLSIMVGGSEENFKRADAVFSAYGNTWQWLGDAGSGQLCKMVNQVCIAGVLEGLSEGLALASKAGLDLLTVQKVLAGGAAQSWQLENRAHTMAEGKYDFGFAIDWMVKDLGYCLDEAASHGLQLPNAQQVIDYYKALQQEGHNRDDTSALFRRYQSR